MKTFLLFLFFIFYSVSSAQDLKIKNNPYDNADEQTKSRKAFQRERWFYEQRMYPDNYIPKDAYKKAYEQREAMRVQKGYSMSNPFNTWTNIGPTTGFYFAYSNITSRMPTVKYDPNNPNVIYVGTAFGESGKQLMKELPGLRNLILKFHYLRVQLLLILQIQISFITEQARRHTALPHITDEDC